MTSTKTLTVIRNILKNIIWVLFPLMYISYIIYIRFFLIREPRLLFIPLSYTQIFIILFVVIILIIRIYVLLIKEDIIKPKESSKIVNWVKTQVSKFVKYHNDIWRNFYHLFTTNSLQINFAILKFCKYFSHITNANSIFIVTIFQIVPRIILLNVFLIEIFAYHKLYYFYKVLMLLILPLIFLAIREILFQFYADNMENLQESICVKTDDNSFETYELNAKYEHPAYIKDIFDFMENHYMPVYSIKPILIHLDTIIIENKINWLYMLFLVLHIIGWLTILFFGLK